MRNRILAVLVAIAAIIGLSLATSGSAQAIQAGQAGYQYVNDPGNSASGFIVQFACGNYSLNPTWNGGEGMGIPPCGDSSNITSGSREPHWVWLGQGSCATRSVWRDNGTTVGYQNLAAGDGHWFELQQPYWDGNYHNVVKVWYGSGCPASGSAWVDNYPPGVPGYPYAW